MKSLTYLMLTLSVNSLAVFAQGDKPRFSIGLGVLAPSYSQKFAGNGRLDFDQGKDGFSYNLNNGHGGSVSYQSQSNPQTYGSAPAFGSGSDYRSPQSSPQGTFNIYQHQSVPKQSAPTFRSSESDDDYSPPESSGPSSANSRSQFEPSDNGQYSPSAGVSGGQGGYDDGSYREAEYGGGYYNPGDDERGQDHSGPNEPSPLQPSQDKQGQQGQANFGTFNFEQQIAHQIQEAAHQQPFQSPPSGPSGPNYQSEPSQTYQSQPSHSPAYQSQPSHQRVIRLESQPIQSQRQSQYRPQSVHALRV